MNSICRLSWKLWFGILTPLAASLPAFAQPQLDLDPPVYNADQSGLFIQKQEQEQEKTITHDFVHDFSTDTDPRIIELLATGASREEIVAFRGPVIQRPEQAIHELRAGNSRFMSGQTHRTALAVNHRRVHRLSQTPIAAVLGCADSRVPTEMIYDQGLGSLFTMRNAGNIADAGALGSLEYAVKHLKVTVIVVMGHQRCGAVHGALLPEEDRRKEPAYLQTIFNQIIPAFSNLSTIEDPKKRMREAVISNVLFQVNRVNEDLIIRDAVAAKRVQVIGAYYGISSGAVEFLETPEEFKAIIDN